MGELCCREVPGKRAEVYSALMTSSCSDTIATGCSCMCVLMCLLCWLVNLSPLLLDFKVFWLLECEHFQRRPFFTPRAEVGRSRGMVPILQVSVFWPQWWSLRLLKSFKEYSQVLFTVVKAGHSTWLRTAWAWELLASNHCESTIWDQRLLESPRSARVERDKGWWGDKQLEHRSWVGIWVDRLSSTGIVEKRKMLTVGWTNTSPPCSSSSSASCVYHSHASP